LRPILQRLAERGASLCLKDRNFIRYAVDFRKNLKASLLSRYEIPLDLMHRRSSGGVDMAVAIAGFGLAVSPQ